MSILKLWLTASAVLAGGWLVWNYAPILIPLAAVALAFGLLTFGIVRIRNMVERQRGSSE
jgi:hypothetical protein